MWPRRAKPSRLDKTRRVLNIFATPKRALQFSPPHLFALFARTIQIRISTLLLSNFVEIKLEYAYSWRGCISRCHLVWLIWNTALHPWQSKGNWISQGMLFCNLWSIFGGNFRNLITFFFPWNFFILNYGESTFAILETHWLDWLIVGGANQYRLILNHLPFLLTSKIYYAIQIIYTHAIFINYTAIFLIFLLGMINLVWIILDVDILSAKRC